MDGFKNNNNKLFRINLILRYFYEPIYIKSEEK